MIRDIIIDSIVNKTTKHIQLMTDTQLQTSDINALQKSITDIYNYCIINEVRLHLFECTIHKLVIDTIANIISSKVNNTFNSSTIIISLTTYDYTEYLQRTSTDF